MIGIFAGSAWPRDGWVVASALQGNSKSVWTSGIRDLSRIIRWTFFKSSRPLPRICVIYACKNHYVFYLNVVTCTSDFCFLHRYGKIVSTKAILDKNTNQCKGTCNVSTLWVHYQFEWLTSGLTAKALAPTVQST